MADGSNFARGPYQRRFRSPPEPGARLRAEQRNPKFNWTDERVERLKKLWADGRSASFAAKELGGDQLTRSAVLGKIHRLGLPPRAADVKVMNWTQANRAKAQTQAKRQPGTPNVRKTTFNTHPADRKPTLVFNTHPGADATHGIERAPTIPQPEPTAGLRTTLTVAFRGECKWPMSGEGAEMTLCGCRAVPERPYCLAHEAKSRNPVQPKAKDKDLIRALRRYV